MNTGREHDLRSARRDERSPDRTGHSQAPASHRNRHTHARHDRRTGADLDRVQYLHAGSDRREPVPDAAKSLEPVGSDLLDRHHGDRHGAGHRHAPYRSVGRIDHRFRLDHHRRRPGAYPAGLSRPRQSGDLDHRGRRSASARRGDRRLSRLARRLSRHSRLHRHARRPVVLARRRMVGDDRPDHRAARRPLRSHGRRSAWLDRRHGKLGSLSARLRGHRFQSLRRAPEAGPLPFPATADVGRIYNRSRSGACLSRARLRS